MQRPSLRADLQSGSRSVPRTVGRSFLASLVLLVENVPPAAGALRHKEPQLHPNFPMPPLIYFLMRCPQSTAGQEGDDRCCSVGGAIVVLGEPGIGKTALMEQAVASAQDFRALRTAGQEGETELAYAALQQLCAPGLDRLVRLPAPQRDAVRDYENLPASHEAMILWTMIALMTRRLTQPTELSDAYLQNRIICASPAGSLAHASTSNRRLARPSTERHDRVDDRRHRQRHAGQRISMPARNARYPAWADLTMMIRWLA